MQARIKEMRDDEAGVESKDRMKAISEEWKALDEDEEEALTSRGIELYKPVGKGGKKALAKKAPAKKGDKKAPAKKVAAKKAPAKKTAAKRRRKNHPKIQMNK